MAQEKPGAGASPAGLLTGRGPAIPCAGRTCGQANATSREEAQLAAAAAHPTIALPTARSWECPRSLPKQPAVSDTLVPGASQ